VLTVQFGQSGGASEGKIDIVK